MNPSKTFPERLFRFVSTSLVLPAGTLLALASWAYPAETVLVQLNSVMRYHIAASAAVDATWMSAAFDDNVAGWTQGTYGVGYSAGGMIKTAVATSTHTVYTRARFAILDLAAVETVWLGVDYDDGYIAWINGTEVARINMPGGAPAFGTDAAGGHESSNGATPSYDPYLDITLLAKPALVSGENVLAIGIWNDNATSTDLALVPHLSINRPVAPPGEVHWTAADSPVQVTSTLTVPRGTTLRIDPGVTVDVAAGAGIHIAGQIIADGTEASRIIFDRAGTSGSWSGLTIDYGSDGVVRPSSVKFATLTHGTTLIDINATGNSEVLVEDCIMDSWSNVAIHWDNGANGLRISRCRVGMSTPASEQSHEAVNGYRSNAVLEFCIFGPRLGYNDTIDLGNTKWGGPVPTVQFNEILSGQDDGIDFDNCDGYIIGNFIHGRRPPANGPKETECPQFPIAGGGMNGGGITGNEGSRPVVMNNIVYDCFHGIGYKNAADPTIINNTVVNCTWGIVLFETADIANPAVAHGTLVNNLIWGCAEPLKLRWCDAGPLSSADVKNCVIAGGWPGTGNISPTESPLAEIANPAKPTREDFRLRGCSPAIDAGFSGQVSRPFHSENVPAADSEGNSRVDMLSVANTGSGTLAFVDLGALEYTGPDECAPPQPGSFLRGEANGDGQIDIADAVSILFVLFAGMSTDCKDAIDTNDDGAMNVTDAIRLLQYLFTRGPEPPAPFSAKGEDPTSDSLDCQRT